MSARTHTAIGLKAYIDAAYIGAARGVGVTAFNAAPFYLKAGILGTAVALKGGVNATGISGDPWQLEVATSAVQLGLTVGIGFPVAAAVGGFAAPIVAAGVMSAAARRPGLARARAARQRRWRCQRGPAR